ncbi:MAG: HTH domain-containing protein [Saprospiraceae bacterium]
MNFFEKITLIERMDQLLRMKGTGTSEELANRLGISRSTLYEMLETMRNMGAEIEYNASRKTYYYTTEKVLAIGFVEKEKIKGGKKISKKMSLSEFFGQVEHIFAPEAFQKGDSEPSPFL